MAAEQESVECAQTQKEIYLELLEYYKNYRCLWDISCSQYSNRDTKWEAYNVLLEVYKKIRKDATVGMLKKKIENMRTAYRRELKKVQDSTRTRAGAVEVYVPRLWYFDSMSFLDEKNIHASEGIDTLSGEDDNENLVQRDIFPSPKVKKLRNTLKRKQDMLLDATQRLLQIEDDWNIIGRSIGLQLRDLSENQRDIAQKLIADVIFHGKMKRLNEHTTIHLLDHRTINSSFPSYTHISPHSTNSCSTSPTPSTLNSPTPILSPSV